MENEKDTQGNAKTSAQRLNSRVSYNPYTYESLVFPQNLGSRGFGQTHYILFNINETEHKFDDSENASRKDDKLYGTRVGTVGEEGSGITPTPSGGAIVTQATTERNKNYNTSNGENLRDAIAGGETFQTRRIKTSIALQMPENNLTVSYGANWENAELGKAAGTKSALQAAGFNLGNGAIDNIKSIATATANIDPNAVAAAVLPQDIEDVFVLVPERIAKNPRVEVLFRGFQNRTFNFQFKLSPSNQKEAHTIKHMIDVFKFAMAPRLREGDNGLGSFFEFPDEFDITFWQINENGEASENDHVHKISTCALTAFNVDYSSVGRFATFEDGYPVEITIDLTFSELELLHKGRISEGY